MRGTLITPGVERFTEVRDRFNPVGQREHTLSTKNVWDHHVHPCDVHLEGATLATSHFEAMDAILSGEEFDDMESAFPVFQSSTLQIRAGPGQFGRLLRMKNDDVLEAGLSGELETPALALVQGAVVQGAGVDEEVSEGVGAHGVVSLRDRKSKPREVFFLVFATCLVRSRMIPGSGTLEKEYSWLLIY